MDLRQDGVKDSQISHCQSLLFHVEANERTKINKKTRSKGATYSLLFFFFFFTITFDYNYSKRSSPRPSIHSLSARWMQSHDVQRSPVRQDDHLCRKSRYSPVPRITPFPGHAVSPVDGRSWPQVVVRVVGRGVKWRRQCVWCTIRCEWHKMSADH